MGRIATDSNINEALIMLGILESVERDGTRSQRLLAAEFGVALGLINAYLKRCVRKGLVKVTAAPARRYKYYLTPRGFAEKSRLTFKYLSCSLSFFRRAKEDCMITFSAAKDRGWSRILLAGVSDLAEIATICSLETGVTICGVVDSTTKEHQFIGFPIFSTLDDIGQHFDGVMITDLSDPQSTYDRVVKRIGGRRVCVPQLLGVAACKRRFE